MWIYSIPSFGYCLAISLFCCIWKTSRDGKTGEYVIFLLIAQTFLLIGIITIAAYLYSQVKALLFPFRPEPKVPEDDVIVLPEEPPVDAEGVVNVSLKCPNGRTFKRRLLMSDPSSVLVDWMHNIGYSPTIYAIFEPYPRRPVLSEVHLTLEDIGITENTSLNVELKAPKLNCYVKEFVNVK